MAPRATAAVVACIQEPATQERADPGHGLPPVDGGRGVLLGQAHDGQLHVVEQWVVVPNQGEVHRDIFLDRRRRQPLDQPVPLGRVGHVFAEGGEGILAVRMLHVRQECCPRAYQRHPPPQEVPRRPHLRGIDVCLRECTPTEQPGNLVGIALVVLGLAAVDGLHREGMPEHEGHTFAGPEVGQPVPGKDTGDGDDEIGALRGNRLEQGLRAGFPVAVQHDVPVLVQDTNVHAAGVQVDATIRVMLCGVKSQELSSSFVSGCFPVSAYHRGRRRRGPQ